MHTTSYNHTHKTQTHKLFRLVAVQSSSDHQTSVVGIGRDYVSVETGAAGDSEGIGVREGSVGPPQPFGTPRLDMSGDGGGVGGGEVMECQEIGDDRTRGNRWERGAGFGRM